jgi:hypothetical protein
MIILPRQARDKSRENSKTGRFVAQHPLAAMRAIVLMQSRRQSFLTEWTWWSQVSTEAGGIISGFLLMENDFMTICQDRLRTNKHNRMMIEKGPFVRTEILDAGLLGEHILPSLRHAR